MTAHGWKKASESGVVIVKSVGRTPRSFPVRLTCARTGERHPDWLCTPINHRPHRQDDAGPAGRPPPVVVARPGAHFGQRRRLRTDARTGVEADSARRHRPRTRRMILDVRVWPLRGGRAMIRSGDRRPTDTYGGGRRAVGGGGGASAAFPACLHLDAR